MRDTLIRLAGLFKCDSAKGNKYFTGLLNSGAKLVMLTNKDKKADNEPDLNLYLTERRWQGETNRRTEAAKVQAHQHPSTRPSATPVAANERPAPRAARTFADRGG